MKRFILSISLLLSSVLIQSMHVADAQDFDLKSFFEKKDNSGKTYLHRAIEERTKKNLIQNILKIKFDINIQDNEGKTPLLYAVKYKNIDAVKLLLEAGANPSTKDTSNRSPLIKACSIENNANIITELLNGGADNGDFLLDIVDVSIETGSKRNYDFEIRETAYIVDKNTDVSTWSSNDCSIREIERKSVLEFALNFCPINAAAILGYLAANKLSEKAN